MIVMRPSRLILASAFLLAACTATAPEGPSAVTPSSVATEPTQDYVSARNGFAVTYPKGWALLQDDHIVTDAYEATGTAFLYPPSGKTALLQAKFHVATLPACPDLPDAQEATINGIPFRKSYWSGAGAGNLYEGMSYTTMHNDSCVVLTGYMHSCNLGPDCGPEHSEPFDRQPLVEAFETMAGSFRFMEVPQE